MPLQPGDKLGPYEVVALLGKGGMGEVYRARDPKLNRDVAIKVLPAALANDADYLTRFQREAQTLAALNHPNIAAIYGLEADAIVMELVEGETLQGPLAIKEALPLAKQIAEALEAAHEKGIIHRDLKPGNIKVTPGGVVKVLDFGLAKAVAERATPSGADSPTLTLRATEAGLILGTAGYMSPEQAAGKPVDRRTDIWSFGVVLYELLTGKRMFDGETVTHTLADVVRAPIDLALVEDPQARHLIGRCLDRNKKTRLRDIGEARIAIENYAPAQTQSIAPAKAGWWPWAMAGVATLACLAAGIGWYNASRPAPPRPLIRVDLAVPSDTPLARVDIGNGGGGNMLSLSPDGARVALSLRAADGKVRLHTRLLQQSQFVPLAGTENAHGPFFSPGGDWIGFFADGKMKKIAVEGGDAVTLCDAPNAVGASWGDDGNIIVALSTSGGLSRVPSAGGTPVPVTKLNAGEVTHRWPQVLPGSQAILFTASAEARLRGYSDANIEVVSLQTGERKTLLKGGYFPHYLAAAPGSTGNGHLIYMRQHTVFAVPFDAGRLAVAGAPAPILPNVEHTVVAGGDIAFAGNGTVLYLARNAREMSPIWWVDRGGGTAQALPPGIYSTPRFSPDGRRMTFRRVTRNGSDIWVKDLDRDTPSRLSFLPGENADPVWTPDGKTIVFRSENPAAPGVYAVRSDGSGEAKRLAEEMGYTRPYSFSPDGKRLAITQTGNGESFDIFTVPVEADSGPGGAGLRLGKPELFLGTPFVESSPAFSPDGRWLAYQSIESGIFEVYVRPFLLPGGVGGGRWQVSTRGGRVPRWSRDGRELLFLAPDGRVMAAAYSAQGTAFTAATPRVWTETVISYSGSTPNYDIAPDGKRLAAIIVGEDEGKLPSSLTFLMNFGDELRRRAPAGK